jgi:nitric oxide reductase NorE protein
MTTLDLATGTKHVPARATPTHVPGDIHMWVFVLGDLIIFGIYFIVFMAYRVKEPAAFIAEQHHLNVTIGAVNTLVLLTSSWFVARGVQAARHVDLGRASALLRAGSACGLVFIAVKALEWSLEIHEGHTLSSGTFLACYFMFTGVHLMHVVLGLIILGIVQRNIRAATASDGPNLVLVEAGGIFWHMVDLLWVVIFALLYVMR